MTKLSKEEFIEQSKKIYNNKYDYSQVEYKNTGIKVKIICPIHGEFYKTPMNHLNGQGCPNCSRLNKKMTTEEFIEKARKIHGDKYDYSKVEYINSSTKVCIICSEHGEFWQTPNAHIIAKHKCPKCTHPSYKKQEKDFINEAREIHGDKYDYSKVEYINSKTKVCIICPKHGEFWQLPYSHLKGNGCPNCVKNKKLTQYEFLEKAKYIHNNFYDYSKVIYKNTEEKVCIICPEHGEFWQTPHSHLSGVGCPICSKCKNLNETALYEFINSHISEKVVREKHLPWLGMKSLDIFIPKYNIAIEYQGKQHFMPLDFFGGEKGFKKCQERDIKKNKYCKNNNIQLIRIPYTDFQKINPEYLQNKIFDKKIKNIV